MSTKLFEEQRLALPGSASHGWIFKSVNREKIYLIIYGLTELKRVKRIEKLCTTKRYTPCYQQGLPHLVFVNNDTLIRSV